MHSFLRLLVCSAYLLWYIPAYTREDNSGRLDSLQYLDEVSVIANKYSEVIPSQKLSGPELERLNSHSIADAMRYFSGIQIKDYGGVGGLKTIDLRSLGTNHVGMFYDGIQLGNVQNGQVDLGKFSLDNIEEISLYNGQKSEIFQPAKDFGSSGTVYFRTRRPRFAGDKRTNLRVFLRAGSFDLYKPSVLWEQKISDHVSSSVNAEYMSSSGKYKFRYKKVFPDGTTAWDTTMVRQNGDMESFRLEGGLNGFSENSRWHTKLYYYQSEKGLPGAIVNNIYKQWQRQWDKNFFVQGSFVKEFSSGYEGMVNAKYAYDYMRFLSPDTTLMYVDNQFYQQEAYISFANKYRILQGWDLSLSADHQWNKLNADLREFVYPVRHTTLVSLATAFEAGPFKGLGSLLGTFVQDKVRGGNNAHDTSGTTEYTPAIFLSWRPFPGHDFLWRGFYKHIFRMPTLNDLYYTDIGNIYLEPEYTVQYDIGFEYNRNFNPVFRNFNLKADAYYNEVENKIVALPKLSGGLVRWMMMNIGMVKIRGIDISSRTDAFINESLVLHVHFSYTFQKAQDYTETNDKGEYGSTWKGQLPYIPNHNGSAVLGGIYKSWDFSYSFIYVGGRYTTSANIPVNYEQPWYTHDLAASKTLDIKNIRFKLTAEVNNLLDQAYDVVRNYPMPGRNYRFMVRMDI